MKQKFSKKIQKIVIVGIIKNMGFYLAPFIVLFIVILKNEYSSEQLLLLTGFSLIGLILNIFLRTIFGPISPEIEFFDKNIKIFKKYLSPAQMKIYKFYIFSAGHYAHMSKSLKKEYEKYLLSKSFYIKKRKKVVLLPNQKSFRMRYYMHAITAFDEGYYISGIRYIRILFLGEQIYFLKGRYIQ